MGYLKDEDLGFFSFFFCSKLLYGLHLREPETERLQSGGQEGDVSLETVQHCCLWQDH